MSFPKFISADAAASPIGDQSAVSGRDLQAQCPFPRIAGSRVGTVSAPLTRQLIDVAAGPWYAYSMERMAGELAASTLDTSEGLASFREKKAAR
jgi:hypothetical protein